MTQKQSLGSSWLNSHFSQDRLKKTHLPPLPLGSVKPVLRCVPGVTMELTRLPFIACLLLLWQQAEAGDQFGLMKKGMVEDHLSTFSAALGVNSEDFGTKG